LHAECVLSADRQETVSKPEPPEQQNRQAFELVGADGELPALGAKRVERIGETGKNARSAMWSE
jgi:hypothetical protein